MNYETLTEFGRFWAEANAADSILARVALAGYDSDWPSGHVETAIIRCNESGADVAKRLEELRAALHAESISYGEIAELQSLAAYIDEGDVELREAAGVPEFS